MDVTSITTGFSVALSFEALLFCFIGVTIGTFVGALPGIGALAAISMSLPLTLYLEPTTALIMLAGIFYGSQYGSSISSILINIPGTATAAVTCLDGYPMAQQGRAGQALFITAVASFVGGSLAIILLMLFAPTLARISIHFNSADYFSVMLFALVASSSAGEGSPLKGISMVLLGIALGFVGTDVTSGYYRFTFDIFQLTDGISLVALAMGLFGVVEILNSIGQKYTVRVDPKSITVRGMIPTLAEMRRSLMPTLRGSFFGSAMGILPGTGATIATFISYIAEKRIAKHPEQFGNGAIEGVAAPEAANNAAVQAAFIPTLSLGIPGDAVMAILLGAMLLHGVTPGPQLISEHPDMFWGLVASFWVGNVLLLVLNIPLIGIWVRLLSIPYYVLYPAMLFFICIGVFSVRSSTFDVAVCVGAGVLGYGLTAMRYPVVPLLLGFILGPMIEENFRRTMLISAGDPSVLVERPISAVFLGLSMLILLAPHVLKNIGGVARSSRRKRRKISL